MVNTQILALSSSRVGNGAYLEEAVPMVRSFLRAGAMKIAFVPFAFVAEDATPLLQMVQQAFEGSGYSIHLVSMQNGRKVIEEADAIMVCGGNTFKLLHDLYASGLLALVQEKVHSGIPYIGWSAGSNITGATICTTNDMPVIEPQSFRALGFFPFQINPHYYNQPIQGFNGETRDQRLTEYVLMNPDKPVVCLPEGTSLLLRHAKLEFTGKTEGVLMRNRDGQMQKETIAPGADISVLLQA